MRRAPRFAALIALAIAAPAFGKGSAGGHSGSHSGSHSAMHSRSGSHGHSRSSGSSSMSSHRAKHRNGKRSEHARNEFMSSHPCPSTGKPTTPCPGYAIGGAGGDDPSMMQWQAVQAPM